MQQCGLYLFFFDPRCSLIFYDVEGREKVRLSKMMAQSYSMGMWVLLPTVQNQKFCSARGLESVFFIPKYNLVFTGRKISYKIELVYHFPQCVGVLWAFTKSIIWGSGSQEVGSSSSSNESRSTPLKVSLESFSIRKSHNSNNMNRDSMKWGTSLRSKWSLCIINSQPKYVYTTNYIE